MTMDENDHAAAPLDVYLDDFGRRLGEAAPRSRRRRRIRTAGTGGAVVLASAVVVLALVGLPRGSRINVIAQARAALSPGRHIVHMVITSSMGASGPRRAQPAVESWSASGPDRWRTISRIPVPFSAAAHGGFVVGLDGYPVYGLIQYAFADHRTETYNPARDTITVSPRSAGASKEPSAPSPLGPIAGGADPASQLQAALSTGTVVDQGTRRVAGRTVRRLVSTHDRRIVRHGHHHLTLTVVYRTRFVYDVDPKTFAPVDGELDFGAINHPPRDVTTFRVGTYQRIALTSRTAHLLRIPRGPATRVVYRRRTVGPPPPPVFKCWPKAAFLKCRADGTLRQ